MSLAGIGGAAHHPVIPVAVGASYRYGILVVHLSGISKLPGSPGLQIGAKTTVNYYVSRRPRRKLQIRRQDFTLRSKILLTVSICPTEVNYQNLFCLSRSMQ
jgi:hypothetical protein